MKRKVKFIRSGLAKKGGFVAIYDDPGQVKMGATETSFIEVSEKGISLAPGIGGTVNIQALPGSLSYGGIVRETPFPLALVPSTLATPIPSHIIVPPFKELIPLAKDMSAILTMFVGR